jgi:hypothetical protein
MDSSNFPQRSMIEFSIPAIAIKISDIIKVYYFKNYMTILSLVV